MIGFSELNYTKSRAMKRIQNDEQQRHFQIRQAEIEEGYRETQELIPYMIGDDDEI